MGRARTATGEKFVLWQEEKKKKGTNELAESYAIQEINFATISKSSVKLQTLKFWADVIIIFWKLVQVLDLDQKKLISRSMVNHLKPAFWVKSEHFSQLNPEIAVMSFD